MISGKGCGLTRSSPGGVGHLWGWTAGGVAHPARSRAARTSRLLVLRAMACRSVENADCLFREVAVGVVVQPDLFLKVRDSGFQFRFLLLDLG